MAIQSTIPGAITALLGYMTTVSSNNPSLNLSVHLGEPISNVNDNFMAVGSFQDWSPVSPETYEWATIPGSAKLRNESYDLQATIRCYSGNVTDQDKLDRLNDAFTLLNGLHQEIVNDLQGGTYLGEPTLTGPGSWGSLKAQIVAYGPLDNMGYGCVLGLELAVINAQLAG